FFVRNSKLIGRQSFILQGTRSEEPEQIMTSFIKQFYDSSTHIPPLLLLQYEVEDRAVIENWLQCKRGSKVRIHVPHRGRKKKIVNTAAENSSQGLAQLKFKQLTANKALTAALTEISKELHLPQPPLRIEGYDISNIQGKAAVGSVVVFERGMPKPSHYRRFRIKTVLGADDCAMLQEVLSRRFKRSIKQYSNSTTTDTWTVLPDLVLIDGGKGQLSAARSTMSETEVGFIPIVAIAKEKEELFVSYQSKSIVLPHSSLGLQLLQRIRDEAHRFALCYHRKIHKKEALASALDNIPGIGSKRKHALLNNFGTIQAIRKASIEELAAACNMAYSLAMRMKEYLRLR
ncbi:helix-hairpin-helix domain-containing protein, partial [Chloroflexota bacterium]